MHYTHCKAIQSASRQLYFLYFVSYYNWVEKGRAVILKKHKQNKNNVIETNNKTHRSHTDTDKRRASSSVKNEVQMTTNQKKETSLTSDETMEHTHIKLNKAKN